MAWTVDYESDDPGSILGHQDIVSFFFKLKHERTESFVKGKFSKCR